MFNKVIEKQVQALKPGDFVLHPLYRHDGLMLISRYKQLDQLLIEHIRQQVPEQMKILTVNSALDLRDFTETKHYLDLDFLADLTRVLKEFGSYLRVRISEVTFVDPRAASLLSQIVQKEKEGPAIFATPMWQMIEQFIDTDRMQMRAKKFINDFKLTLQKDSEIQRMYDQLTSYHDVLTIHSSNTTCISILIGLTLELSDQDILNLGLATLFADIGFIWQPKEKFSQYLQLGRKMNNLYIEHIRESLRIVQNSPLAQNRDIVMGMYDHHEHYDGSGVPSHKKGEGIHLYARIIAIAQRYDELVGGYFTKQSMPIIQALNVVWDERGKLFDDRILRTFVDRSNILKVGGTITLPSFKKAKVLGFKDYINEPLLPVIKLEDGRLIDLLLYKGKKDEMWRNI